MEYVKANNKEYRKSPIKLDGNTVYKSSYQKFEPKGVDSDY